MIAAEALAARGDEVIAGGSDDEFPLDDGWGDPWNPVNPEVASAADDFEFDRASGDGSSEVDNNDSDDSDWSPRKKTSGRATSMGDWTVKQGKKGQKPDKNQHELRSTAAVMSRMLQRPGPLAACINAYLEDLGILREDNKASYSKLYDARRS